MAHFTLSMLVKINREYEFAYKTLLKAQITQRQLRVWAHFQQEIADSLASLKLSNWFEDVIVTKRLDFALDWDTNDGLKDFPVVTIDHRRSSELGHTFASVAWAGRQERREYLFRRLVPS